MLKFIQEIEQVAKFQIAVFGGKVLFEGTMLTPLEAEAAGLASSLIASTIIDPRKMDQLRKKQEKIENMDIENPSENEIEQLLNMLHGFNPDQLLAIEEQQNKILCNVIKRASEDNGQTWQQIHLVQSVEQQDAERNILWIGMLPKEDRKAILDKAMKGHGEVASFLQTFQ